MNYTIENQCIVLEDLSEFQIRHVVDCGQVFRYKDTENGTELYAKNEKCLLRNENDRVIIKTDNVDFFVHYFDLERNYAHIKDKLAKSGDGMADAVKFGEGIRLLNQDPLETVISFIISANNNIPRIKKIIEKLCEKLGERRDGYYGFPTLQVLCGALQSDFDAIGAGYRSTYLYKAVRRLAEMDLNALHTFTSTDARRALLTVCGIGKKVADCILLFAYKKTDLFPMDTWSKKIYSALGYPQDTNIEHMSMRLGDRFGHLAGYAQQYLYYYFRENKIDHFLEGTK